MATLDITEPTSWFMTFAFTTMVTESPTARDARLEEADDPPIETPDTCSAPSKVMPSGRVLSKAMS